MIKVVFMGTPKIAVNSLKKLLNFNDIQLLAVVTQPDRPAGRGNVLTPPPVKECAVKNAVPVLQTESIKNDSVLIQKLRDLQPDFFITFAFGGVATFLLLLHLASASHMASISVCMLWGVAITAYNLVFQSEVIRVAPEGTTIAMSIYSGIYNVGIACGALTGGAVCSYLSIKWVGYVGGAIALTVALICFRPLIRRLYQ